MNEAYIARAVLRWAVITALSAIVPASFHYSMCAIYECTYSNFFIDLTILGFAISFSAFLYAGRHIASIDSMFFT